ncbi:MAG: hypothetical protein JSW53_05530 [Candidatus Bathyarchaeota archaeon]|nr:MAG: hypothetical protein JSW53_05530 [Candidatus Bathyarchaeota archaeon]
MEADFLFRARTVHLILARKPEEALERLSEYYNVEVPKVKIGMPKGHVKSQGCYVPRKKTIYFSHRDAFYNPYVVLHEFYHHLRTRDRKHKGTEKLADAFAKGFIESYKELADSQS